MQVNQCGPQVVVGGPVPWQAVNPGTTVAPESQSKSKRRRGTSTRTCTSIFQASLGVVLIVTGIVVISVVISHPSSYTSRESNNVREIESRDKRSWGIWCGSLFIFTAAFGLFSRRSQVVISLYMAFSIFASLLAFCGLVSAGIQVGYLATAKKSMDNYRHPTNPCKPDYNVHVLTDPSMECEQSIYYEERECVTIQEVESCIEETRGKVVTHLVCHAIMLACFLAEFVVSIVGASFTCIGLECCSQTPPQHVIYYPTQDPQFTGQRVVLPPGAQILHPQQYPVGMPPPAGAPIVQAAPMVYQTSPPQDEYLIPDAPPAYQPQIYQQEYAYADEPNPTPASAPPSYEAVNQGEGNNGNNDPLYITVVE